MKVFEWFKATFAARPAVLWRCCEEDGPLTVDIVGRPVAANMDLQMRIINDNYTVYLCPY